MAKEIFNTIKKINASKVFGGLIITTILLYGIFRIKVLQFYTSALSLVIDSDDLSQWLNGIFETKKFRPEVAGWVIYYPSYLILHLLFIAVLFNKKRRTRNFLLILLISVVGLLLFLILISKLLDMKNLFDVSYHLFKNLFGLPFILLAIEGGRILYNDILELSQSDANLD